MLTKKIIYTGADGNLYLVYPAENDKQPSETEDQFITRIRNKDVPPTAVESVVVDTNIALPPRNLRKGWSWNNVTSSVDLHLGRTRSAILEQVRQKRDSLLDDSDKMKAKVDDIGTALQKTQVATYRQQLRDLPQTIQDEIAPLNKAQLSVYVPSYPLIPNV